MIDVPKIEGEVQRWELTQHWRGYDSWETMEKDSDGEWVRAEDYAALNEYSALVEMKLQAQIDLNEAYEARLLAEVERLRGIVQADLEEKAEAWGEVERLRAAYAEARDMVLNDRGPLAEAQMDTAQTNAVLATIDALWPTLFSDGLPANKEGSRDA